MAELFDRRTILKGALAGAAGIGATMILGGFARQAWAAGTVRVTNFGGPYQQLTTLVGAPFASAGLGTVEYSQETSGSALAKMQADKSNPPFDVTMLSRAWSLRAAASGQLKKLDMAKIPNARGMSENLIVDGGFGLSMLVDNADIMYDSAQVEGVTSWADLWDPALSEKIALPASTTSMPLFIIALGARALGSDENDPKAVDEVFAKLAAVKGKIRTFVTDPIQATNLIERGEVAIAPQYGIRISSSIMKNPNIRRANTKEGIAASAYDLCITAASPVPELSEEYINFCLAEAQQKALAIALLATPARPGVELPPEIAKNVVTDMDRIIFFDETFLATMRQGWLDRWKREIQS
jgi:putative spermidine/putrescine transport system substrate-binding protein